MGIAKNHKLACTGIRSQKHNSKMLDISSIFMIDGLAVTIDCQLIIVFEWGYFAEVLDNICKLLFSLIIFNGFTLLTGYSKNKKHRK